MPVAAEEGFVPGVVDCCEVDGAVREGEESEDKEENGFHFDYLNKYYKTNTTGYKEYAENMQFHSFYCLFDVFCIRLSISLSIIVL